MSVVLTYGAMLPVVKVGRLAGQFAKPRTEATETVDGVELPSFRGTSCTRTSRHQARTPIPNGSFRLLPGGVDAEPAASLYQGWLRRPQPRAHVEPRVRGRVAGGQRYEALAGEIERALRFMQSIGIDLDNEPSLHEVDVWTSHEGLLLEYEEALTRTDSLTGRPYDCSAHMLWIGERTRGIDGAHVEFFSSRQPDRVKLGPTATGVTPPALAERLNPADPGPLDVHHAHGCGACARGVASASARGSRQDSRRLGVRPDAREPRPHAVRDEDAPIRRDHGGAARLLRRASRGRHVAGRRASRVHGRGRDGVSRRSEAVLEDQLDNRYETLCDPRLNGRQSLDLAFRVAELMRAG